MLTYHFCETVTKSTRMAPEGYNECYHTLMRACWEGNDAVAVAELASHPDWLDRRIDCRHHPKRRLFFLLILLELWVSFFVSIILMIVRVIVPGTVLVKILVCLLVIPVQIAWGGVIFISGGGAVRGVARKKESPTCTALWLRTTPISGLSRWNSLK